VDSKKRRGSQEEPLSWTYGVVVKVNGLERRLTLRLSSYRVQTPRKVSAEEKWITMLVAVVANTLRHLNLKHAERLKLYVCQDLSCSLLRKQAVLIHAVAETLKTPQSAISVEFVTKDSSRSKRAIAEQYKRAHVAANRKEIDVWCDPQEVERILSLVHRAWLHR
jgi:hypothetical protein